MEVAAVLDTLARLAETRPLREEAVAAATGISFAVDPERSNIAKAVLVGGASADGAFASALLQFPTSATWGTAGLLELVLGEGVGLTEAAVVERFGAEGRVVAPTVSMPPGSPFSLQYTRATVRLSFMLDAGDSHVMAVRFVER